MLSAKKVFLLFLLFLATTPILVQAAYVSTQRDTQENPHTMTDIAVEDYDALGYAKLTENDNFVFYWQEARDVLVITDKRNGYTWKTGLDVDAALSRADQASICKGLKKDYNDDLISYDEFETGCAISVDQITGLDIGVLEANSLLSFSYFSKGGSDSVYQTNNVYSATLRASINRVVSTLQMVDGDNTQWRFSFYASELGVNDDLDLQIYAYLSLTEEGFEIDIPQDELSGTALPYLSAITLAPFLGAVGGLDYQFYTTPKVGDTLGDYDYESVQREMVDGYSFVPDGPGSLIRFRDNTVSLTRYSAYVYGGDPSVTTQTYLSWTGTYVPFKTASIPVFGMAHGDNQAAYVAYATSGDPYMYIISVPEENTYHYNYTYARFNYNYLYEKLYTMDGDNPVSSISDEMNSFDVHMNYDFLSGDGTDTGYAANYVGMALKYKDYLKSTGQLTEMEATSEDVGLRLDFLMADSENSIVGYQTQVATTTNDVADILNDVIASGITNISSGLIGWQKGGVTIGDPTKAVFSSAIGSKRDFSKLISEFASQGVDISLYQDYYWINETQVSLYRNAAKHPSGWYARLLTDKEPIFMFYYARPDKSVLWLENQTDTFQNMGVLSVTVDGMTNHLITDYTLDTTTRTDSISLYRDAFSTLSNDVLLNLTQPNGFLFQYTDRYLQMNVYSTQYLIETDTVPFLQILLQNTMELYAIYSNFSFYTDSDVLRMIDYNVYPSFVITKEPSHVLANTDSAQYYSTEYTLYADSIRSIYERVNSALSPAIGATWTNREVLAPGFVRNTYSNGVQVYINYTDLAKTVGNVIIPAVSFTVVGGE